MMIGTSGGTRKMDQNGRFRLEMELENPMSMDDEWGDPYDFGNLQW